MKSEILDKNQLTNIQMGMVWTLPEGTKFPDWTNTDDIPEHWLEPTYVFLESGSKSGATDWLKYSGVHDTRDSWNPADYYGPGIIQSLGLDPGSYQKLESVLLPELIDPEDIVDPERVYDEPWDTNLRFFGTVGLLDTRVSLLRLPADTWKVEFYSLPGVESNLKGLLIPSEFQTVLEVYPVLRVTFGPDYYLANNPIDMYTVEPKTRKGSVTDIEYKRQLDELRSSKILAIKFTSAGLERLETFNISTGAWHTQKDSGQIPERHKTQYYLGKAELLDTHDIKVAEDLGKILIDPLSGVLLGTSVVKSSPVRSMIYWGVQTDSPTHPLATTYTPHARYRRGDEVNYQERYYTSGANGNIDGHPILSDLWDLEDPDFPEPASEYRTVSLYTEGPGDIQFPESGTSMLGYGSRGFIGTTEDYLKLRILPEPGYILDSPNPFSYDWDQRTENMVAENDNIYTLRFGLDSGGFNFCFRFIPIETSVITDFRVPGYNYYTYDPESSRYDDYQVTYNSLSGHRTGTIKSLPKCTGMIVSYVMGDSEKIPGATFESTEGISLRIPSTTDIVKTGTKITLMYHGLLDHYDITDWNTGVTAVYHNNTTSYEVPLSRAAGEVGQDGNSLWVKTDLKEAITHFRIDLIPKPQSIKVTSNSGRWEPSTDGSYVHIGQSLAIDLYGDSGTTPVVELINLVGNVELEQISSRLWKATVSGLRLIDDTEGQAGTINIQ